VKASLTMMRIMFLEYSKRNSSFKRSSGWQNIPDNPDQSQQKR